MLQGLCVKPPQTRNPLWERDFREWTKVCIAQQEGSCFPCFLAFVRTDLLPTSASLVAKAFDRIELRGTRGWDGAEDDPHNRRHDDGDDCRKARNWHAVVGEEANGVGDGKADHDAGNASRE